MIYLFIAILVILIFMCNVVALIETLHAPYGSTGKEWHNKETLIYVIEYLTYKRTIKNIIGYVLGLPCYVLGILLNYDFRRGE